MSIFQDVNGKPLKVDDAVVVVKASMCCNNPRNVGRIFKIGAFFIIPYARCQTTGNILRNIYVAIAESGEFFYETSGVKKIEPLDDTESLIEISNIIQENLA